VISAVVVRGACNKGNSTPFRNRVSSRRTRQRRFASGLRFLRALRLAKTVEGDRLANKRLEGGLVNLLSFVDVDRAAHVSIETRVGDRADS
jgi:hypothetical protein